MTPPKAQGARFPELEPAAAPPEARGLARDAAGVVVSVGGRHAPMSFCALPGVLEPGDLLVVNESATRKAAVDLADYPFTLHVSSTTPDGDAWIVELRTERGRAPFRGPVLEQFRLAGGAEVRIRGRYNDDRPARLLVAELSVSDLDAYLDRHGRWIQYGYAAQAVDDRWYQTVFARTPGSAEMPSAGRGFTTPLLRELARRGVAIAPLVLHTGVSSQEDGESPHDEWFSIPERTVAAVTGARGRVVAVGTTVVRALESWRRTGVTSGWTKLLVKPNDRLDWLGGLLSGFHRPRATHLDMLSAFAGVDTLVGAYGTAARNGFRSHEFGDFHLILR